MELRALSIDTLRLEKMQYYREGNPVDCVRGQLQLGGALAMMGWMDGECRLHGTGRRGDLRSWFESRAQHSSPRQ